MDLHLLRVDLHLLRVDLLPIALPPLDPHTTPLSISPREKFSKSLYLITIGIPLESKKTFGHMIRRLVSSL